MKDLVSYRLFTRVARLGSFSAGREHGLSQSQVSRIVADLGARLFARSTRAVVPTEAGAKLLASIEPILSAIQEAERNVREGDELRGIVRISMPTSAGVREIIPRLGPFIARNPNLHIRVLLADHWQDLIRENVDVAIRMGTLLDSSATSRQIMTIARFILASPAYLAEAGTPRTPEDLRSHRIIGGRRQPFRADGRSTGMARRLPSTSNLISRPTRTRERLLPQPPGLELPRPPPGHASANSSVANLSCCSRTGRRYLFPFMPIFLTARAPVPQVVHSSTILWHGFLRISPRRRRYNASGGLRLGLPFASTAQAAATASA